MLRSYPPSLPPLRRVLHLTGWNAVAIVAGLMLIAVSGEVSLRLTRPFMREAIPSRFSPKVGLMGEPNAEVRWTNGLDFWTTSRTNSLGFLDREPLSSERTAESCHITMIGDSFVEAREVVISDKFHVQLEEMATRQLPHLNITTSAFGYRTTGQINQLPFYEEYARRLRPKLLVLVFVDNDFMDNSAFLDMLSIRWKLDPKHLPFVYAERGGDGKINLRPPDPDWASRLPRPYSAKTWIFRAVERAAKKSYLADWLDAKMEYLFAAGTDPELIRWLESLSSRPGYETFLDGWSPAGRMHVNDEFEKENPPLAFKEALAFTAFALDQFKARTQRDNASLVILATYRMRQQGSRFLNYLNVMARERGIPVVDQYDYITSHGNAVEDAHWPHDAHWNPTGHRWAAEALLAYLKQHPEICAGLPDGGTKEVSPLALTTKDYEDSVGAD